MSYADLPCKKAVAVLTEYMEGWLDAQDRSVLEQHLVWCDWCATYFAQLRHTTRAARSLQDENPPPTSTTLDTLLARFRASRRS